MSLRQVTLHSPAQYVTGVRVLPYVVSLESRVHPSNTSGFAYREMLEKPRPHDVCGHLGENAALFLPLLILVWVIVIPCARRRDAVV